MSLLITAAPGEQDSKKGRTSSKTPKKNAVKAKPVTAPVQFPTPTPYKEPSPAEQLKSDMDYSKRSATRRWVEGDISTAKHNQVHARAKQVLKGMKVGR